MGEGRKNQQTLHFCCRKAKNSCFAPKTLIYEIFAASVEDKILRKFANEKKLQAVLCCADRGFIYIVMMRRTKGQGESRM